MVNFRFLPLLLLAFATTACADTLDITLGAGTTGALNAGPDVVETVGNTITPTLTLGVASTLSFYTPTYVALCTTCTGKVDGTMTSSVLNVADATAGGSGTGSFSQMYSDASSGASHTFTPLASTAISIALTNGDTLVITPLAGSASTETAPSTADAVSEVTATFLLEQTPSMTTTPEPSSMLLLFTGLGVAGMLAYRRSGLRSFRT